MVNDSYDAFHPLGSKSEICFSPLLETEQDDNEENGEMDPSSCPRSKQPAKRTRIGTRLRRRRRRKGETMKLLRLSFLAINARRCRALPTQYRSISVLSVLGCPKVLHLVSRSLGIIIFRSRRPVCTFRSELIPFPSLHPS